ncbi:MAG: YqgE/AlgH family protein [Planctomycetes bacterium]|nr:YqgE/AlgH family protein [Planctomycetota bacterium]
MALSLRGQLLIAGQRLRDPNFYKTVVLIVEHGDDGAMGLVINRPSSVSVPHALAGHFELPDLDELVYVGGPVQPTALFILHNSAELNEDEAAVVPGVYVGGSANVFERVVESASEGDPDLEFRVLSGCAGWAPGQLESELARGDWLVRPASAGTVFADNPYDVWDEQLQQVFESNRILPHTVKNPEWN